MAFPEHQYIPSCFDSACNAFVKLVFQYEQTVVMEDIPLTATCREVRNYLVQKSLFPSLPSLTGWRLLFSSVILDDEAPISTYSLPQCARIQICRIDEEETPTPQAPLPERRHDASHSAAQRRQARAAPHHRALQGGGALVSRPRRAHGSHGA